LEEKGEGKGGKKIAACRVEKKSRDKLCCPPRTLKRRGSAFGGGGGGGKGVLAAVVMWEEKEKRKRGKGARFQSFGVMVGRRKRGVSKLQAGGGRERGGRGKKDTSVLRYEGRGGKEIVALRSICKREGGKGGKGRKAPPPPNKSHWGDLCFFGAKKRKKRRSCAGFPGILKKVGERNIGKRKKKRRLNNINIALGKKNNQSRGATIFL